jgi:hypothetical protein
MPFSCWRLARPICFHPKAGLSRCFHRDAGITHAIRYEYAYDIVPHIPPENTLGLPLQKISESASGNKITGHQWHKVKPILEATSTNPIAPIYRRSSAVAGFLSAFATKQALQSPMLADDTKSEPISGNVSISQTSRCLSTG